MTFETEKVTEMLMTPSMRLQNHRLNNACVNCTNYTINYKEPRSYGYMGGIIYQNLSFATYQLADLL